RAVAEARVFMGGMSSAFRRIMSQIAMGKFRQGTAGNQSHSLQISNETGMPALASRFALRQKHGLRSAARLPARQPLAAANVRRLTLFPRKRSEPTHVGCYGIDGSGFFDAWRIRFAATVNEANVDRSFYLPRLPREYYQGDAVVHWTLPIS